LDVVFFVDVGMMWVCLWV